tara:strand:- start:8266 stop:8409 length:144 start_codon:yes stop_codon:yes gene_type:complete
LAGQFLIIKEAEEKYQAKKQYTQIERIITLSVESQYLPLPFCALALA